MWLLCALLATAAQAAGAYVGRPVDAALRDLAAAGQFQLVYTSELVPADALIEHEPRPGRRSKSSRSC